MSGGEPACRYGKRMRRVAWLTPQSENILIRDIFGIIRRRKNFKCLLITPTGTGWQAVVHIFQPTENVRSRRPNGKPCATNFIALTDSQMCGNATPCIAAKDRSEERRVGK